MARPNKLIQFYLTNMCNSRCRTCNIWKNTHVKNIRINEIPEVRVIDIIKEYPEADYVFGGGEFTLYRDRYGLLNYCDNNNIKYTILSNAVNYNLLKDILDKFKIKNLTISCDGIHHDYIRGVHGNLENIEKIIKEYKDKIPNIKISYTLSTLNESSIDSDMEYFKNLGFEKIYFCIAQNMDLLKAEEDIIPSMNAIKYLKEKYSYMLYDKDVQLIDDIICNKRRICDSIKDVHTIYTNGDVVRCQSLLSNSVIGNIYNASFKSILEKDKKMFEERHFVCIYNDKCTLVCQRRYDYEDRI